MTKSTAQSKSPASANASTSAQPGLAYDAVPYTNQSYSQTNPLLLQGIGQLFGLKAPAPDKARYAGNRLRGFGGLTPLPSPAPLPGSRCVGIDYSAQQIEVGKKDIEAMGSFQRRAKNACR